MPKIIKYKIGDILGNNGIIYLGEYKFIIHPCGQRTRQVIIKCNCGVKFIGRLFDIKHGRIKSCGCIKKGIHGMCNTKIYNLWRNIKTRCYRKNNWKYKYYGGKGVKVYEPWIHDFMVFYSYISLLPNYKENKKLTLDRIDNDGNYEPGNLRWVTMKIQNENRSI